MSYNLEYENGEWSTGETVAVPEEIIKKLDRLTKKELIEKYCVAVLEAKVANNNKIEAERKLTKAEEYVEQARCMLEATMERWYEY